MIKLAQTRSNWINLVSNLVKRNQIGLNLIQIDQTWSKLINLFQNESNLFKLDQIRSMAQCVQTSNWFKNIYMKVFFGHGRVIHILGYERAINIFGYWTAINIIGYGKLGLWATWTLGNLSFGWLGLWANWTLTIWVTWTLDSLGDLDFGQLGWLGLGQLVYSNYWETCVLKNLTRALMAESISGLFF